jgi:hypothetical protein
MAKNETFEQHMAHYLALLALLALEDLRSDLSWEDHVDHVDYLYESADPLLEMLENPRVGLAMAYENGTLAADILWEEFFKWTQGQRWEGQLADKIRLIRKGMEEFPRNE